MTDQERQGQRLEGMRPLGRARGLVSVRVCTRREEEIRRGKF